MSRFDAPRIVAASRRFISEVEDFDRQYDSAGYDQYRHRTQSLIVLAARELYLALEGRTRFGDATVPDVPVCDYRSGIQCAVIRECLRRLLSRVGAAVRAAVKDKFAKADAAKDDAAAYELGLPPLSDLEGLPWDGLPELSDMKCATDKLESLIPPIKGSVVKEVSVLPNEERDEYIYQSRIKKAPFGQILQAVNKAKGWTHVDSEAAIFNALKRYCERKDLILPRYKQTKIKQG